MTVLLFTVKKYVPYFHTETITMIDCSLNLGASTIKNEKLPLLWLEKCIVLSIQRLHGELFLTAQIICIKNLIQKYYNVIMTSQWTNRMIAFLDLNWLIVSGNCVKYCGKNVFEIECMVVYANVSVKSRLNWFTHREILQRSFCRIQQLCNYCNTCANICFISFYRFWNL